MILQESEEVFVAFLSSPLKDALQGNKERGKIWNKKNKSETVID